MGKRNKVDDKFLRKKTKQCYNYDICTCKSNSFSSESVITSGIYYAIILRKEIWKRSKEFNWGKSPDQDEPWSFCFQQ